MKHVSVSRWFVIVTLSLLCVISLIGGIGLIFSSSGAASSKDVETLNRRGDCRSAYNADFTEKIRLRDALVAQGLVAAASGNKPALEEVARQVAEANEVVLSLPKLNDAVDKGYKLDGVKHPPCPG